MLMEREENSEACGQVMWPGHVVSWHHLLANVRDFLTNFAFIEFTFVPHNTCHNCGVWLASSATCHSYNWGCHRPGKLAIHKARVHMAGLLCLGQGVAIFIRCSAHGRPNTSCTCLYPTWMHTRAFTLPSPSLSISPSLPTICFHLCCFDGVATEVRATSGKEMNPTACYFCARKINHVLC